MADEKVNMGPAENKTLETLPLAELPVVLQQIRARATLGQNVPKSGEVSE